MKHKLGIYLKAEHLGRGDTGSAYGLRFRDNGGGYDYERAGTLSEYSANTVIADELMPVHAGMRRCVVGYDGELKYYLDADNSMWRHGEAKEQSVDNADGRIIGVEDQYGEGKYVVEVSGDVDAGNVGKVMNIFDGVAHNFWYAVILDADDVAGTYTLSHPHIDGFGEVGAGNSAFYMIGTAVLDGKDGNVMVEIPGFWHRWRYYGTGEDDAGAKKFRGWQEHLISLEKFSGAKYFEKRYIGAFEGVSADVSNKAYDGWSGTIVEFEDGGIYWDKPGVTVAPNKIVSVVGFYPRTSFSLTDFRGTCEATGEGYHQYDFVSNFILQLLIIVEYASFGSQTKIGAGVTNLKGAKWSTYNGQRAVRKTGDTIAAGNMTWKTDGLNMTLNMVEANSKERKILSIAYRGVEQPYGHLFKWLDGVVLINNIPEMADAYYHVYVTGASDGGRADYENYKSHDDLNAVKGDANWGIKGDLEVLNVSRYWKVASPHLLPNDNSISSTAYCYDYFYLGAATQDKHRVVAVGGSSHSGVAAGSFCVLSAYAFGSANAYGGGRLCRIFGGKK